VYWNGLLIYSVPAEPSRKRAYVWREVKKLGAIYLRDGVCIQPEQPGTVAAAEACRGGHPAMHDRSRDYFPEGSNVQVKELLARCDEALGHFLETATTRDS
jgi:hypothetical protein